MALQNGVLVHGPTSWGCAVRLPDGTVEVRERRQATVRAGRPDTVRARAAPAGGGVRAPAGRKAGAPGGEDAVRAEGRARRDRGQRGHRPGDPRLARCRRAGARAAVGLVSLAPAVAGTPRSGPRRLPRRRAHLDRELRARRRACHEGARALRDASGRAAARHVCARQRAGRDGRPTRSPRRRQRPPARSARSRRRSRSSPGWSGIAANPLARALRRPGHELQARLATDEPSAEQLEVAEAALEAVPRSRSRMSGGADTRRRDRLPPEIFDLPVEKMREGYYTDAYFNHARSALLADGRRPRVADAGLPEAGRRARRHGRGARDPRALLRRPGRADRARAPRRRRDRAVGDGDDDRGRLHDLRPPRDALPRHARAPHARRDEHDPRARGRERQADHLHAGPARPPPRADRATATRPTSPAGGSARRSASPPTRRRAGGAAAASARCRTR